jgi:four helix bundle protein
MSLKNLAAYRGAIRYVGRTRPLVQRLRSTDPPLSDQLNRAVISIALNVAEGAGEYSTRDKARFYRYALRSCTESLAILDVSLETGHMDAVEHAQCYGIGVHLTALLTRLVLATTSAQRRNRVAPSGAAQEAEPGGAHAEARSSSAALRKRDRDHDGA